MDFYRSRDTSEPMSTRNPFSLSGPPTQNGLLDLASLLQPEPWGIGAPVSQPSLSSLLEALAHPAPTGLPPIQNSLSSLLESLANPAPSGLLSLFSSPPPAPQTSLGLIGRALVTQPPPYNSAAAVAARFRSFVENIELTKPQFADGVAKLRSVTSCLNRAYWGHGDEDRNRVLAGSWAKRTWVRPPRDIDMLFPLPSPVYYRYEWRFGNKQSQLLQEVKEALLVTFPRTEMRSDGQVVKVNFESYAVEVVPAFLLEGGQYWICDTNDGGRYKVADPAAEVSSIEFADKGTNGNARRLTRMVKKWRKYCNVPLKSFWIELLAVDFLRQWPYRDSGYAYHDWMVRDFLAFLLGCRSTPLVVPGTYEIIWLGDEWFSRAKSAHERAASACELEYQGQPFLAGLEWYEIFGPDFPA